MKTSFTHLHVHSYYSLLDGVVSPEKLIAAAKKLNFRHLALTDHNALYGAVEFFRMAKAAGIHPIIGAEITLSDQTNLLLLVRDQTGYRHLCRLLSLGHLRAGHLKFDLQLKDLIPLKEGLIVLSGGQKGKIWQLLRQKDIERAQAYCRQMRNIFADNFYLELQQFLHNDFLINVRLRDLATTYNIPMVATNDAHFIAPGDFQLRRVLHAIDQNSLIDKIESAGSGEQYLKSAPEMNELFAKFPEALANSGKIAQLCRFEFSLGKPIFPKIDLPEDETAYSYLWKAAFGGAESRYKPLTREFIDRLRYELNTINSLGFTDYFLIVKDIVDFCHREGIPCVGRGSAGDSVVSYVLGITQMDPLRYNLYFERFLNPERSDAPDIDLDICWKNRDRVLEYVYQKYGEDKTAMICTFNTFQLRSSIRDVARTFGFPEDEISAITKYLPHYGATQLTEAIRHLPECQDLQANMGVFKRVLEIAKTISDFPRHQSIHPGGVIIAPDKITDFTPLQMAGKGIVVAQYDMYSIEPLGLVKMDLLGVRSLSIITDCLKSVSEIYRSIHRVEKPPETPQEREELPPDLSLLLAPSNGRPKTESGNTSKPQKMYQFDIRKNRIREKDAPKYLSPKKFPFLDMRQKHLSPLDLRMIPENDMNVTGQLRAGLSMGCFQTESPGMRGLLKKMQIDNIDDVIAAVALIRPGAANSGMKDLYIQRRAGLAEVTYPHPSLAPLLDDTYGGIIYQEQVMQVAAEIAGFSLAQADVLRKAMTKSRDKKTLNSMYRAFIDGAKRHKGLSPEQAENIWKFLANFVGYGFNKAHSATYGVIAYQTNYLKYYFPVQYMTAVLNNHGGFYSKAAYVEEARRMGISFLPPDINLSRREFTFSDNCIRVGLDAIFEITEKTIERVIEQRQYGNYQNYYDFVLRVMPREGEVNNLIKCGAFRLLEKNEPLLLLKNKLFFKHKKNRNSVEALLQNIRLLPHNKYQHLLNEMEMLDFTVSDHPLALYQDQVEWEKITPSFELEQLKGKSIQFVGWLVTSRRVKTQNGEYMKFLTLEDRHGLCEAVMFPGVYGKYGHFVKSYGPFLITGKVQSRLPGEANLLVEKLSLLEMSKLEMERKLRQD